MYIEVLNTNMDYLSIAISIEILATHSQDTHLI